MTACSNLENRMKLEFVDFDKDHPVGESATHPPARPGRRVLLRFPD